MIDDHFTLSIKSPNCVFQNSKEQKKLPVYKVECRILVYSFQQNKCNNKNSNDQFRYSFAAAVNIRDALKMASNVIPP